MIEVLPAKLEGTTAKYQDQYLYSQYEPRKKIEEEYNTYKLHGKQVFLLGLGLGYLLEFLIKNENIEKIYLVETDVNYCNLVKKLTTGVLSNSKVCRIGNKKDLIQLPRTELLFEIANADMIKEKTFAYTDQEISEKDLIFIIQYWRAELFTWSRLGMTWLDNFLDQAIPKKMFRSANQFKKTVEKNKSNILVVGAGPSLAGQITDIKNTQQGYLIVCIDTIRSYLIKNMIYPDATISIDSQYISALHFMGYSKNESKKDEIFLLDTLSSPEVINKLDMNKIFYFKSGNPLNDYFSDHIPLMKEGLSAVNTAIELLYDLGAKRIILAGIDMAFPKENPYTGGNYFSSYFCKRTSRVNPLETFYIGYMNTRKFFDIENTQGKKIRSTPIMQIYADALGDFIKRCADLEIKTLSQEGYPIKGVTYIDKIPDIGEKEVVDNTTSSGEDSVFSCHKIHSKENFMGQNYEEALRTDPYFIETIKPALCCLLQKRSKRGRKQNINEAFALIVKKWNQRININAIR